MSRALFFHPEIENIPLVTSPLAFLHLATAVKDSGHTIELIDGRLAADPVDALLRRIGDIDVLLISAMPGSQIASALRACRAVRAVAPDLPIVWGGAHPSVDPATTTASRFASAVVVGRGEFTIRALLDAVATGAGFATLPNVLYRDDSGAVQRTAVEVFARHKPNPPDFALLADVEPYLCQTRRSRRMLDYISSFGCPHTCTFCSEPITSGSRWAAMDASVLADAVEHLQRQYRLDGILFQDAKFVTDRRRLTAYCRAVIDRKLAVNWIATSCGTDIFPLHQNGTLALMRESGCEQLFIGAEAATPETLRTYHKTVDAPLTYRMAKLLWEQYDILPHFSYVISYPIESMDQVKRTLELHQSICELVGAPTGELGIYNPVPQTQFFKAHQHHFH